jgi:AAA+ ATPase superfamily predicted ATPase
MIIGLTIPILDRADELRRVQRFLRGAGDLTVVYNRRRCGKSTLIQRARTKNDLYFLGDQRAAVAQPRFRARSAPARRRRCVRRRVVKGCPLA